MGINNSKEIDDHDDDEEECSLRKLCGKLLSFHASLYNGLKRQLQNIRSIYIHLPKLRKPPDPILPSTVKDPLLQTRPISPSPADSSLQSSDTIQQLHDHDNIVSGHHHHILVNTLQDESSQVNAWQQKPPVFSRILKSGSTRVKDPLQELHDHNVVLGSETLGDKHRQGRSQGGGGEGGRPHQAAPIPPWYVYAAGGCPKAAPTSNMRHHSLERQWADLSLSPPLLPLLAGSATAQISIDNSPPPPPCPSPGSAPDRHSGPSQITAWQRGPVSCHGPGFAQDEDPVEKLHDHKVVIGSQTSVDKHRHGGTSQISGRHQEGAVFSRRSGLVNPDTILPVPALPCPFGTQKSVKTTADSVDVVIDIDKKVTQQRSQTWKVKKGKEREEEKGEIKFVVSEVRWIKHYCSSHKILLVGEGDFSFSACLAVAFGSASNMIATSLDSQDFLEINYKFAMSNIKKLKGRGCKVMHGVDATKIANHELVGGMKFDRVIFNFPFAGFFKDLSREFQLRKHRRLVSRFLKNAKEIIEENGEIHISHKTNGFHKEWKLEDVASSHKLKLIEAVNFSQHEYPGYHTKCGFGGDNDFDCYPSKTYKFGCRTTRNREILFRPENIHSIPIILQAKNYLACDSSLSLA